VIPEHLMQTENKHTHSEAVLQLVTGYTPKTFHTN